MTVLTVAAGQLECVAGDIGANLELHLEMIGKARSRGVDLLVFAELSLSDYVSVPDLDDVGLSTDAPEFAQLATAAGDMRIAVGFIEVSGPGHFIAHALIEGGGIVHVHRKINLQTYGKLEEGLHYAAGRDIELADISGWRSATQICADAWNPAIPWLAALKGADLMLVPAASSIDAVEGDFDNPAGWDLTLRQIALTYGCPVVMTNHCGIRGKLRFWGGSRIIDAFGREIARAGKEPELLVAELDLNDVAEARRRLPTVRDANPGLIRNELSRFLDPPSPR